MKHSITFNNVDNNWDNALPLGNGCFGCMVYFKNHKLNIPMNHYEVYYNIEKDVLPQDKLKAYMESDSPGTLHEKYKQRADDNQPLQNEPFCNYGSDKKNAFDKNNYGIVGFSGSYPATGNLSFNFSDSLHDCDRDLTLFVEDAKAVLSLKKNSDYVTVDTIVTREDCVVNHVKQSACGNVTSFQIEFPPYRDLKYPDITYTQIDSKTFSYTVKRFLDEKDSVPFVFSGIVRLIGSEGSLSSEKFGATITLKNSEKEFFVMTSVFTEWKYKNPQEEGLAVALCYEEHIDELFTEHKKYWSAFFDRSSITLPDRFLENVYYVNQYALDCCSGANGIMKHHACGLNGLWDVRHPNLWGSMWYWDVNIQAAFAGVFSSNRLDLAKVFSDGLISYVELAEKSAKDVHNVNGIAADYPYSFYYSCWPWCAQYLWFLYEYSLDKEYLKNDAFPVFIKLCEFFINIFEYDEERGYYSIYPDVSPEQGPLTHDSVITVSCVKYLFKFTVEAAKILGEDLPLLSKCKEIMENTAPYPLSSNGMYGVHFKDSCDSPDNMWIRHPSMLMPLFPIGEFDLSSDKETLEILSNTVNFLEDRAEIGIFGGSWISAAAARLGRGQTAYRLLYERGIDHMLRSNGLTAEETDHFINFCLMPRQPLYYPCMMEFTGEMLAALNEMLIQSHNEVIRVFPAIPDGDPEYYRMHIHGYSLTEYVDRYTDALKWEDVRFDKLLAKGAFEVSAQLSGGELGFIKILSNKGGKANVTSPFMNDDFFVFCDGKPVEFTKNGSIYSFDTQSGKEYIIAKTVCVNTAPTGTNEYSLDVLSKETYTKRHIYLGENPEAKYQKAVDYFIRDWYLGNVRMENHTVYKFDFTESSDKVYAECLPRQTFAAEERNLRSMTFNTFSDHSLEFSNFQGFGFLDASKVKLTKRDSGDVLRQDFAEGTFDAEFIIDAPRGQYELFVVSGDPNEDSITLIEAVNGLTSGGNIVKKGQYQCKILPLINEDDEPIRLKISTKKGYKWKVNYIIVNVIKGY